MGGGGVLAGRAVWGLSDAELSQALDTIAVAERVIAAERLAVIGELVARGVHVEQGYASVARWVDARLKTGVPAGSRMGRLAKQLPEAPPVAKALADGEVSEEQAWVIVKAVAGFSGEVKTAAQLALLKQAPVLGPEELAKVGRRILEHVDPDAAEEHERKALEREDKRAQETRAFTVTPDGTGRFRLTGYTDAEGAAILRAALDPLCNPARYRDPSAAGGLRGDGRTGAAAVDAVDGVLGAEDELLPLPLRDNRTAAQRRHDALIDVVQFSLHAGDLPDNGGEKAQLFITAPFDVVEGAVRAGTLDTGEKLTAEAVRRLACDCGVIPAILNSAGVPLDLGRERRLISGALRWALVLRDNGCAFPGCDRPPKWCHAHHAIHWIDGGPTCLGNSVLLCGHHHRLVHKGDWTVVIAADGLPDFIPPAWLDPQQLPRRNTYHRRS